MRRLCHGLLVVASALVGLGLTGAHAHAQVDAGYLADWKDGELRVTYDAASQESSATLALVPGASGEGAPVILVWEARWPGRATGQVPTFLEVRSYLQPLADQRVQRRIDLRFILRSGASSPVTLYFFGGNWGVFGFIPAGDEIPVVRFPLTTSELAALAVSEDISGEAMGFAFALTASQIEALSTFARLVRLPGR
jgi:hypothetical protein